MKKDWRFQLCYYGCMMSLFILLPRLCLPAHDLIFHPLLLLTWLLIIRGTVGFWQDIFRFWQWFLGK